MSDSDDKNAMLYLLAGVGIGALIGTAAGMLFAPKAGSETRDELVEKVKELKTKTEQWITEQRAKKAAVEAAEELGA